MTVTTSQDSFAESAEYLSDSVPVENHLLKPWNPLYNEGMKINFGQQPEGQHHPQERKTFIAQNLIRKSVMLNANGDEIDPRTKQVIRRAGQEE